MIETSNILEAAFYSRHPGDQNAINRMHFLVVDDQAGVFDLDEVGDALSTAAAAAYKPILPATCSYQGLAIRLVSPTSGAVYKTVVGAGAGTGGTDAAPPQLSVVTRAKAPFAYPRLEGRIYWPFPAASDLEGDGTPTAGYLTAIETLLDILCVGTLTLGTTAPDVVLRYGIRKGGELPEFVIPQAFVTAARFGTQRRRSISPRLDDLLA